MGIRHSHMYPGDGGGDGFSSTFMKSHDCASQIFNYNLAMYLNTAKTISNV